MCGIAGWVGQPDARRAESGVRSMITALARRGPDAEGLHSWPRTVFGHRRLSIFDLSEAGRQPMLSADGQIGVVFNGAIYNFLELRAQLENLGHRFHSRTDTEILIEGYQAWGIDELVRRCRGMFAIALWDNRRDTLWLIRDRLGVKPLVYRDANGDGLAFASTAEAIAGLSPNGGPALDPDAVLEFLEFGYVTERRSIYQGISKVPPGHILEWRSGVSTLRRYWLLPDSPDPRITFEDAIAGTEERLLEAVRLRLEADVPVGALLSGGIDSSLVCWAMAKLNARIESFTVGTPGDPADESADAAETAKQLGIPHRVVPLGTDPPSLDELISSYGEPFACSSALGMLRVSQAVKPHATVLLTGDGGDDIYLGYPEHRNLWLAQRAAHWVPPGGAAIWRAVRPVANALPFLRRPKHFLDYATGGLGAATRVHAGIPYFEERGLLGDRLKGRPPIWPRQIPVTPERGRRTLTDFTRYEYENRFVSEFLQKVDGGTMRHALEARSPFLDQSLWEFAARVPFDVRLRGGQLKAILRELASRRLGPAIANRPKRGFTIPVERWLADRWSGELKTRLENPRLVREGWIEAGPLAAAIQEGVLRKYVPTQLWHLLVLESWLDRQPS